MVKFRFVLAISSWSLDKIQFHQANKDDGNQLKLYRRDQKRQIYKHQSLNWWDNGEAGSTWELS